MILGLDFDNTLISYDKLFHRVACDKELIPATTAQQKGAVRDTLRGQGMEEEWIHLQGEVYGSRILDAEPYDGMEETLASLAARGIPMFIVSHKTRTPYRGEPCDLHAAARSWLAQEGFHDAARLGWPESRVFFELTKQDKVARIVALGCTHYVDDLPEILEMLPESIVKIFFAPDGAESSSPGWKTMRSWEELPRILGVE